MQDTTERELTPEEKWERATLANNFIFYRVMKEHPDACRRLLEMLLKIKIEKMEMSSEDTIAVARGSKGIRLDVFVKDAERMFDVELQVVNTGELPERSRYYQALMDLDTLKSGQKYTALKDSHVIFICLEDVFKNGLAVLTFQNICAEDGTTKLGDRAFRHFFIAPKCATMLEDEETRGFFEFLVSNKARSGFANELQGYVASAKLSAENKRRYMEFERELAYKFDEGKKAGERQKAEETAKNFLKMNVLTVEQIASGTGLSAQEVRRLAGG